jgi:sugar phosphate isomerase/epimerase
VPAPPFALSSFWMRGRWGRVSDFIRAGVEAGFAAFEVSGLTGNAFYDEIPPGTLNIVSLHDPAPGGMRSKEMRLADIVLTSLDEGRRKQAVAEALRSIEVAQRYGAKVVVLHLGQSSADPEREDHLKRLFAEGRVASPEADAVRSSLMVERAHRYRERMNALRRSLDELIPCAEARGVRLGLENRPICEVPNWEDMGQVLSWCPPDTVGYWHDAGHAQVQENLGFTRHADWLRAYGRRLIGLHLHDAVGCQVHCAPGAGSVDWIGLAALVASCGDHVVHTVEVNCTVSEEALRAGVEHLRSTGWAQE